MPDLPPLTESIPWWESAAYFATVTAVTVGADYIRRVLPPPRDRKKKADQEDDPVAE